MMGIPTFPSKRRLGVHAARNCGASKNITQQGVSDDFLAAISWIRCRPRAFCTVLGLEGCDAVTKAFRDRDIVPAVEQTHAADGIDNKLIGAIAAHDGL